MCRGPHCLIWFGREGYVFIGCAHCPFIRNRIAFTDETLLARLVLSSKDAHVRLCTRPAPGSRPTRRRRPATPSRARRA